MMGGYAFYVWSAYGIGFAILIINLLRPVYLRKRFFRSAARKYSTQ